MFSAMETAAEAANRMGGNISEGCEIYDSHYERGVEAVAYARSDRFLILARAIERVSPRCEHRKGHSGARGPAVSVQSYYPDYPPKLQRLGDWCFKPTFPHRCQM